MFWLLPFLAVAISALYSALRWRRRGVHKLAEELPLHVTCYPIIGHAYSFLGSNEAIAEPEAMEVAARACLEKDDATMKYLRAVTGNGIIFAPVKIWRLRRKIMAPTFNMRNLQQFVTIFHNQSTIMVELLDKHADQGDFSMWKYITTYTFDAICESALGIKMNAQRKPNNEFVVALGIVLHILGERILSPWLYWDWVYKLTPQHKKFDKHIKIMHKIIDELVIEKRKTLESQGYDQPVKENGFKTFLDLMIESSGGAKGYSDMELREEVMSIVTAGTDTSAVGTAFTTVMLSRYPEVQDKVYQELLDVFGDTDQHVTWQDLPKLKYLEAVIKETLRLYPPAPVIVRDVHETVVLPSGHKLLPGMALLLHFWGTHRNTKYWGDDAEHFRPERFLEGPLRHPAQFLPFSYSLRNCIGGNYAMMSTKTNLSNMLRRYKVLPPASVPPEKLTEPLRVEFDIMMKHVDNFEVRLEHRNKTV